MVAAQVTESIFDKNEGQITQVTGTLVSAEQFTSTKGDRVEVRLSPATVTTIEGRKVPRDKFTIQAFVQEGNMGWRGMRVNICVLANAANFLDVIGRTLTFNVVSREVQGRIFTDYKPISVGPVVTPVNISEADALAMIHGKTPAEVLSFASKLGSYAKVMTVKPVLLKTYPRVTLGPDGRYLLSAS